MEHELAFALAFVAYNIEVRKMAGTFEVEVVEVPSSLRVVHMEVQHMEQPLAFVVVHMVELRMEQPLAFAFVLLVHNILVVARIV